MFDWCEQILQEERRKGGADLRAFDRPTVERAVRRDVANWRTLSTTRIATARQLLREALTRPLTFTPHGKTYRLEGSVLFGGLVAGVAGRPTNVCGVPNACQLEPDRLLELPNRGAQAA